MPNPEKQQVIDLVKTWLKRSNLQINDVLERLQLYNCKISRTTFENTFTTRSHRPLNVPPDLILALVSAFTQGLFRKERCTAAEAVRFATLARLPLDRFHKLSVCFEAEEFARAYHDWAKITDSSCHRLPRHTIPRLRVPRPLTSFVGREPDLATLKHRLTQNRWLTLIGAGGCGKTRLAVQLATAMTANFTDGIFFVSLAPVEKPTAVSSALAQTLGLKEFRGFWRCGVLSPAISPSQSLLRAGTTALSSQREPTLGLSCLAGAW